MAKNSKGPWLGSLTAKVIGVTAVVAASAGLVNGVIDLYNAVANIPTNKYDKANDELFKKHFGKQPLISQPLSIQQSNIVVEMLLLVFDSGDILVRYGDFEQWLPFKPLKTSSLSMLSEALAQTSLPLPSPTKGANPTYGSQIIINVDKLKRQVKEYSDKRDLTAPVLEKSYVLAKLKEDHPSFFQRSSTTYTETFKAEPGYKIVKYDFQLASGNNYQIERMELTDDGRAVRISFALTSGPKVDQYRGWIQGTLKTSQQKVQ